MSGIIVTAKRKSRILEEMQETTHGLHKIRLMNKFQNVSAMMLSGEAVVPSHNS